MLVPPMCLTLAVIIVGAWRCGMGRLKRSLIAVLAKVAKLRLEDLEEPSAVV